MITAVPKTFLQFKPNNYETIPHKTECSLNFILKVYESNEMVFHIFVYFANLNFGIRFKANV